MRVLVLSGGTGCDGCHVEVFEDSPPGQKAADARKAELQGYNHGWNLELKSYLVRIVKPYQRGT